MIEGKKVLAIIPARGGSKGIARKNIRNVGGKPLIAWTIEEAKKSTYIDRLILSSEDPEIIDVVRSLECEVPFVRPMELAQDDTPGIEPVLHALTNLPGYDYVVLLQPTSPLRSVLDIDQAIEKCVSMSANACVSVTEPSKHPYWMFVVNEDNFLEPLIGTEGISARRQDLPKVLALNGAVYVAKTEWIVKSKSYLSSETVIYQMPQERSVDIDSELDMLFVDFYLCQNGITS